jgi:hypothetical protein
VGSRNQRKGRTGIPQRLPALRAPYRYNREVTDQEFVQRVRQHTPSSLLPIVARRGAEFADRKNYQNARAAVYAPWVLAEVARVSLVYGTEFNRKPATDDDLLSCCAAYQALYDPELKLKTPEALGHFLLRMGGQQLTFQQSYYNNLSRTVALLEQTDPRRPPKIATTGWPQRLLGCSLREYVGAAILLYTSALKTKGTFDLEWLQQPQTEEITHEVSAEVLWRVIEGQFAADRGQFRELQQAAEAKTGAPDGQFRRFSFNPLSGCPAVAGITGRLLMPVPAFVVRKASPLGIYYAGMELWGRHFSDDLGDLFETYVGRQLELIPDAVVLPEIAYGRKKGELSVDWFVIFNDCVVLVEVKSTRPTEPIRLADSRLADALDKVLSRAVSQLNRSASMVRNRTDGFDVIPDDRPMIGLIVTMEPFYTVDTPFTRSYLPKCDIPFRVCGASELEHLVTVSDTSVGTLLLDHMNDTGKEGWSVGSALIGHAGGPNKVLEKAWATYPWRTGQEAGTPE